MLIVTFVDASQPAFVLYPVMECRAGARVKQLICMSFDTAD